MLSSEKTTMKGMEETLFTLKLRFRHTAANRMMRPEKKKRMPAKTILLPVMSGVMQNSVMPILMSG